MKLYVTIDFYDELIAAVWTPERLKKYFIMLHNSGISRIYWVDQLEIMTRCGRRPVHDNIVASAKNFPDGFHATAIKLAHEVGLEIFVLLKPYEMGIQVPALSPDLPPELPFVSVVGGQLGMVNDFALEHPEAMLKRLPAPEHGQAHTLRLQFSVPLEQQIKVKFFSSTQNSDYQLTEEKTVPEASEFVEFLLPDSHNFFVLQIKDSFCGNQYRNIVRIYDKANRAVPLTLGILPKKFYQSAKYHLDRSGQPDDGGFQKLGMVFDYFPGIPSSLYNSDMPPSCFFDFSEAEEHALGVSLELNDHIPGFPDPANEDFQQFVQQWLDRDLQMGFDGVEIRVSPHNSPLFWSDYGSGEAVRIARGKAHDSMLKKISGQVRSAGKIMGVHIEDFMYGCNAQQPSCMEFCWNYQSWIDEKLMDEVTAKYIVTDGFTNHNFDMISRCNAAGIKVNVCPFIHIVGTPLHFASWSRQAGADAFNIYEAATVWQPESDGDGFYAINPAHAEKILRIASI